MHYGARIDFKALAGIEPRTCVCVGAGFSREDVKECALAACGAISSGAVRGIEDLCCGITGLSREKLLGPLARQEVLRALLDEPSVAARLKECRRLRRRAGFFARLDRAMQEGRLASAHQEEREVLHARLDETAGHDPLRSEMRALCAAYEAWLKGSGLCDQPLLLQEAAAAITTAPSGCAAVPEKVVYLTARQPEPLEAYFLSALSSVTELVVMGPVEDIRSGALASSVVKDFLEPALFERWHTVDDAAASMALRIAREVAAGGSSCDHVLLIPDVPAVRRAVVAAIGRAGLHLLDPRDPTELGMSEHLKRAFLPLEAVASGYERRRVAALVSLFEESEGTGCCRLISARGITAGLDSYRIKGLESLYERLSALEAVFGDRRTCTEFSKAHIEWLRLNAGPLHIEEACPFIERAWTALGADLLRTGREDLRAPARIWLERIRERIDSSPPPPRLLRPLSGIRLYRLDQAPMLECRNLWVFGMPAAWLESALVGGYLLPERERELLGEFGVRSAASARQERIAALRAWLASARSVSFLDARYEWDGRERESLMPLLRELGLESDQEDVFCEKGAFGGVLNSYKPVRAVQEREVRLASKAEPRVRATDIDRYSRCPFQALAASRWKLSDAREADMELWADTKGRILHEAARILVESRTHDGTFEKSAARALEEAWKIPDGLLKSETASRAALRRMAGLLEVFAVKETEYAVRSGTTVESTEGPKLSAVFEGVLVEGRPDRIDSHESGLFVIDYKTSSSPANGTELLAGYRLQLPFYALAAQDLFGRPVSGVQFVTLDRKGTRSSGVFFKKFNGKAQGCLTNVRAGQSLFDVDPAQVWEDMRGHIGAAASGFVNGIFKAAPFKKKECLSCAFRDLCGQRRYSASGGDADDDPGGGDAGL
ncbi:MAG: hypothetical protein A2583_04770 [Bdellovibrionales bacterium RIFOXYD1_FULL_53_11]|nr:MAG: hypothetical protein A2583_04770 [Bdellovibrionales bacterium RIFOXYD1_FULL_53_11]